MQIGAKLAATLACVAVIAGSIASAATAPRQISAYYSEIERFIEQRAGAVPMGATQNDPLNGNGRYSGDVTMRRAYSATTGPGVDCGACTDPCRSFALAVTVVGGNGRFNGEVCFVSGSWRVQNIQSGSAWVSQPGAGAAPPAAAPAPVTRTVVYRNTPLDEETAAAIRVNLGRLHYLPANATGQQVATQLDTFVSDHAVRLDFSGGERTYAQQMINLVQATNSAVTVSTSSAPNCEPPGGPNAARRFQMCGRIVERAAAPAATTP